MMTGTMGRTMLSSAATVLVDVAASQMVGLTAAPSVDGIDGVIALSWPSLVDVVLGRNGSEFAESFVGDVYFRSCSNVACLRLHILHDKLALFVHAFAWWPGSKQ